MECPSTITSYYPIVFNASSEQSESLLTDVSHCTIILGGTGQVISRLSNDEIDVAIALTDSLLAGIAKGSTAYKLVGSYVTTPLNWAVVASPKSEYQKIEHLRGTTMGVSRIGR